MSKYILFTFILLLSTIKTVIHLSKPIVSEESFLGQILHTADVVQSNAVEKFKTWSHSVWSSTEKLLKCIVLLMAVEWERMHNYHNYLNGFK